MATDRLWDDGAQNERTRLAWQRTTLSALALGLILARLLVGTSLVLAVLIALTAVLLAGALHWSAVRRYTRANIALGARQPLAGDGRSHALLMALVALVGLGALGYLWVY